MSKVLESVRGGLIVSCQAARESPLGAPEYLAAMARCAELAGAVGIRADGPDNIRAIRAATKLPIVGIYKRRDLDEHVYITPRLEEATVLASLGVEIIALDGTGRPRPGGESLGDIISGIRRRFPETLVMADCSTLDEGVRAAELGAHIVCTTLAGYTPYSPHLEGPDLDLVGRLVEAVSVPVFCEGRVWTPEQARMALDRGATAVVVGTAITNPRAIAERFVTAMRRRRAGEDGS